MGVPTLHERVHELASTTGLGQDHTVAGLTAGMVLKATAADDAGFGYLTDLISDIDDASTAFTLNAQEAAHTGDIFEIQDEGSFVFRINDAGNVVLATNVGFHAAYGLDESTYPNYHFNLQKNWTATGANKSTLFSKASVKPSADSNDFYYGANFEVSFDYQSARDTGSIVGGRFGAAWTGSAASRSVNAMYGVQALGFINQTGLTPGVVPVVAGANCAVGGVGQNLAVNQAAAVYVQSPTVFGAKASSSDWRRVHGVQIGDMKGSLGWGSIENAAIKVLSQSCNDASEGNVYFEGGNWDTGHVQLGNAHIWFNGSTIYGKTSAPTSGVDGTDLTASGGTGDLTLEWLGL